MLLIFDLDGVLWDSKDLHFAALNSALEVSGYPPIPYIDHLTRFDGLPTSKKLKILFNDGLTAEEMKSINIQKQLFTADYIRSCPPNPQAAEIIAMMKKAGWGVAVASNSLRATTAAVLKQLGISHLLDFVIAADEVRNPKPHPEMYWKAMLVMDEHPRTTWIAEDSPVGREAAYASGANVIPIKDTNLDKEMFKKLTSHSGPKPPKWDADINVVIPMAGAGSRFADAGYTFPKPLIEVHGKPMIQAVVESLNISAHYIFIVQEEHYEKYNLRNVLNLIAPGCDIVRINGQTDGAARTVLKAEHLINSDKPLVIANSDQIVKWDSANFLYSLANLDGGILTFKSTHPKWSYARVENGLVVEVAEKNPISDNATVGIYLWNRGSDFVKYAHQMIDLDKRVNGEYYVAPVFNEAIAGGLRFGIREAQEMWGVGTPEDLNYYLERNVN